MNLDNPAYLDISGFMGRRHRTSTIFSVYQGAYLAGVGNASLVSPMLPWKDSYKRTHTCLQFEYTLPDSTKVTRKGKASSLEVHVGTKEGKVLLWKISGYHGNRSSKAQISWESRKDVMV